MSDQTTISTDSSVLYEGARGIAVKVLTRIEQSDAYLDKLLKSELEGSELNTLDKRLLTELTTGVLRWQGRLDWILTGFYHGEFSKCIPIVKNALRVALYQILLLDRIPHSAAVNESVKLVKRLKGVRSGNMVNAVLRSIIRKLNNITWPDESDPAHYMSITLSHPYWMVNRWLARYGQQETDALLRANNTRPAVSLRVNPLRTTPDELLAELLAQGIEVRCSEFLPDVLHATHIGDIGANPALQGGRFTVQDEGAVLASRLAAAEPGMRIIDLCAAPGGKTTAVAEQMGGHGQIISVDKYDAKLPLITRAAERLGLGHIIQTLAADARTVSLDPADVVLLDAPCSGLGVLSRKPDMKWKRSAEDIDVLATLQRKILEHAAILVRPSGHLVYSTCTIEPTENQHVVSAFLAAHPEFELVNASGLVPDSVVTEEGFLQTLPHRHGMDGTFGARMRKKRK